MFQMDQHNVYIRAQWDLEKNWVMSQFQISGEDVEVIMQDLKED